MATLIATTWEQIREFFGYDDFKMNVTMSLLTSVGPYWILNAFLLYSDLTGKPRFMTKYKVQDANTDPVEPSRVWNALKVSMFNQIFLGIPSTMFICWWMQKVGCSGATEDLPSLFLFLRDFATYAIVQEIGFYYSHRLIHYGALYKYIHKQHHEWTAPIGITAMYAHPIEFLLSNIVPVGLGPVLMKSHMITMWVWYAVGLSVTTIHHSGYHLPFLVSPEFHDYHHLKFNQNFGTLGILDWLHGTDSQFKQSVQYRRHRMWFGLRPINSVFPLQSRNSVMKYCDDIQYTSFRHHM